MPQDIAKRAKVQFNTELSGQRYPVVISLFDQMVTFRLKGAAGRDQVHPRGHGALKARPNARAASYSAGAQPGLYAAGGRG